MVKIKKVSGEEIIKSWDEIAKKHGVPVKKMLYGDKLCEKEFDRKISTLKNRIKL